MEKLTKRLERKTKSYSNKVKKLYGSIKNPNRFYNLGNKEKEVSEYGK